MTHDEFDVYTTAIKDTHELNNGRRQLDNLSVTLTTFILTGEAYLTFYAYSHSLENWVLAGAAVATSLVGLNVTTRWYAGQHRIDAILRHRYEFLRNLESTTTLRDLGATCFTEEWKQAYRTEARWFQKVTVSLQITFGSIFVTIPTLFILAASHSIPAILNLIPPL